MPAPLDLLTLRLFLAAHETRNLTRAAERCAIAPSAATRRLQALEARYGAPLFERGARGLTPTKLGDTLARRAASLLALAERAQPELMGPRQLEWLDRLERENGNLRAAMSWVLLELQENQEPTSGLEPLT